MNFFTLPDSITLILFLEFIAFAKSVTLYEGIFGTKISPPIPFLITQSTILTPSSKEILNLVINLLVIGKVPVLEIFKNKGTTEPLEPKTFPYLTTENLHL